MRPRKLSLPLVLLLGISIAACSNDNSSLKNHDGRNTSSNKISEHTPIPSEDNKEDTALEAYKAVLQNKVPFISTDDKENVYLNDFLAKPGGMDEVILKILHFTTLDMDDDKIPEVVLQLMVGQSPEFFEVLHDMNGEVYGYMQVYRGLENLKTDGSFGWSSSASNNGYGKLRFKSDACETDNLGYRDGSQNNDVLTSSYFIDNKPVTEEAYDSFRKEEDEKKDVEWYEFSQENIETKLSKDSSIPLESVPSPAESFSQNLCLQDESLLFGFPMKDSGKLLSLCSAKDQSSLTYRYGKLDQVELEFPSERKNAWQQFEYSYYLRGGGDDNEGLDLNSLTFTNGNYSYEVYDEYSANEGSTSVGIRVTNRSTQKVTELTGLSQKKQGSLDALRGSSVKEVPYSK